MTNKMKLAIVAAMTAIAGYSYRKLSGSPEQESSVTWVNGEDGEDDAGNYEPLPMFYVGDTVLLYSPYTAEFVAEEGGIVPKTYEIEEYTYDEEEEVFRYKISGDFTNWYSEDWLSLPAATTFKRILDEDDSEAREKAESLTVSKILDGYARQNTIDRLLDKMAHGTGGEKAEAERQLRELADKGEL